MKAVTPGHRPKGTSRPLEAAPSGCTLRIACQPGISSSQMPRRESMRLRVHESTDSSLYRGNLCRLCAGDKAEAVFIEGAVS
jgi:hypothetical protein